MHNSEQLRARNYHCSVEDELAMSGTTTRVDVLLLSSRGAAGAVASLLWLSLHRVTTGEGRETGKGERMGGTEEQ